MDEYIDLEAAFNAITDFAGKASTRSAYEAIWKSARALKKIPAADVAPVGHGRWVEYQIPPIICCSNCDWATGIEEKNFQYCPNCGAKMDGGDSDEVD